MDIMWWPFCHAPDGHYRRFHNLVCLLSKSPVYYVIRLRMCIKVISLAMAAGRERGPALNFNKFFLNLGLILQDLSYRTFGRVKIDVRTHRIHPKLGRVLALLRDGIYLESFGEIGCWYWPYASTLLRLQWLCRVCFCEGHCFSVRGEAGAICFPFSVFHSFFVCFQSMLLNCMFLDVFVGAPEGQERCKILWGHSVVMLLE